MTEPLDLDAIDATRDLIWECKERPQIAANTIRALTAELRACRAERDELWQSVKADGEAWDALRHRANDAGFRAEAERQRADVNLRLAHEMRARAEKAEVALARMSVRCRAGNWVCGTCGTELRGDHG